MGNVQKRPDGRWRARYRGPDRRERSKHFDRKIDAERWLASIETAKSSGQWIDPARSRVTVGDWCATWLDAQADLKPTTLARYRGILTNHVGPAWGRVPLGEVTPADVSTWVAELTASGLSAASVRYCHVALSSALSYAVLDGRLARNPAAGVKLPKVTSREKVYLTHVELGRLAEECGEYSTMISTFGYCGPRWGEGVAWRVRDLDLLRRRLAVAQSMTEISGRAVFGTPKDHERREVPVPPWLVEPLTAILGGREPDALLFAGAKGAVLRNGNFRRRVFDPAARRAGVEGLTPHGLRHTAASLAIQAGASVLAVCRMLGHANPTITLNVYGHLWSSDLDDLMDRVQDAKIKAGADQVRTGGDLIRLSDRQESDRNAV